MAQWRDRFAELGVGVAGMTYDDLTVLKSFHTEASLNYPLLRDEKAQHVDAFGIRNMDYAPGERGYGIPHPGIVYLDVDGKVVLKFAIPGYRERPPMDSVYDAIRKLVSQ